MALCSVKPSSKDRCNPEDVVTLSNSTSSLCVHLFGATVISWKVDHKDYIFVSTKSHFDNKKAIRGGIPIVFPNFGPWLQGPQHGFARIQRWQVEQQPDKDASGDVTAVFLLIDNEETRALWDYKFELRYKVSLLERGFTTLLQVTNSGLEAFDFTCLLHTYFHVDNIDKVIVTGLSGSTYIDKVQDGAENKELRQQLSISDNVDSIYMATQDDHCICNVTDEGTSLRLVKTKMPDTVVWNPWIAKAATMSDMGDQDYKNMLCLEAGHVTSRITLPPGEVFTGQQTITLL